jgi:hypothetical protein
MQKRHRPKRLVTDDRLAEVNDNLQKRASPQLSKTEQAWNFASKPLSTSAQRVVNTHIHLPARPLAASASATMNPYVAAVSATISAPSMTGSGDTLATVTNLVRGQISTFAENSQTLITILDEIGKAHPFIQGAFAVVVT